MKFCYINSNNSYPQDKHIIDGLRENGHDVLELNEKKHGFNKHIHIAKCFRRKEYSCDAIIVGFTSPLFVHTLRCISNKKIIFNAALSQYEANIISRGLQGPRSLAALKWRIIDFISFHLASFVLLESAAQIDFVHKFFLVPRKKLVRSWTGVDEKEFFYDPGIKKNQEFTVLFRGRFLPESGILTVIETAKKLENKNIRFLIIGHGFMYREVNALMEKLKPKNIEMISKTLPVSELRNHMLSCHISLGQLADHPRLSRTLPCKLFESLALKLPYLTGRNTGVLELLKEDDNCIAVEPGNSNELAEKILFLKNNPNILEKIAEQGYKLYKKNLTSQQLAKEVVENCFK